MSDPLHNHPFEEVPDAREGYRTFKFETQDRRWRLMTCEDRVSKENHSMIICNDDSVPWNRYRHLVLDGIISVPTAVAIIARAFYSYKVGYEAGYAQNRADVRKVLGV